MASPFIDGGIIPNIWDRWGTSRSLALPHYAKTLRLEDLSAQTGLNMSSFKRAFAETFNMTPWSYITTIRLNAARKLLEETNKMLSEIALDTGFFDQSHFSRTFKRERGITPGEYRRRHQPPVQLARTGASASIQMS